jgi:putative transposase
LSLQGGTLRCHLAQNSLKCYNGIMPTRNSVKIYVEDGYYHLYNRGVEKRLIFLDMQDYGVFLSNLKEYLSPKDTKGLLKTISNTKITARERDKASKSLQLKNYSSEIMMLAFCLRPNHFHFFVKQSSEDAIDRFMSSMCTRYTNYFNRKYKRVGALYQGVYKAVLIDDESQYLHISRYIHKQAMNASVKGENEDRLSSYPEYLGIRKTDWVHPEEILSFFSPTDPSSTYERFVAEYNPLDDLDDAGSLI